MSKYANALVVVTALLVVGWAAAPAAAAGVTASDASSLDDGDVVKPALADDHNETEDGNETEENETEGNETTFGEQVSSFVEQLQNASNVTMLGPLVATFVLENNPGNAPVHAGPPAWLVNDSVNESQGPPDHAGPPDGNETGPPNSAGNGSGGGGPPDDPGSGNGGGGPPDGAGNGNDSLSERVWIE